MPSLDDYNGTSIFIDANIFIYVFTAHPRFGISSHNLIKKIEDYSINGFTSPLVIIEVIHKLICFEISERFNIKVPHAISYHKKNPSCIKKLIKYRQAIELIYNLPNLHIVELKENIFRQSFEYINQYQLLASDAVYLATCVENNLQDIATNDADFERAKLITVWRPNLR
jgi:predicted nucleic acid-binding protein